VEAATRRNQDDPDQTGQEGQSCSQEEEGWGERTGRRPAAGGPTGGGRGGGILGMSSLTRAVFKVHPSPQSNKQAGH